jgi:hypothetical protein
LIVTKAALVSGAIVFEQKKHARDAFSITEQIMPSGTSLANI